MALDLENSCFVIRWEMVLEWRLPMKCIASVQIEIVSFVRVCCIPFTSCAVNTYHEILSVVLGDEWVECLDLFVLVFVYETVIMSVSLFYKCAVCTNSIHHCLTFLVGFFWFSLYKWYIWQMVLPLIASGFHSHPISFNNIFCIFLTPLLASANVNSHKVK